MPRPFPAPPRALLAALALLAAAPLSGCMRGGAGDPFAMISIEEVERLVREGDALVVDANTRETYARGHLPGAVHYKSAPFAELLPADRERRIVFYCASPT